MVLVKELTKTFETFVRGTIAEVRVWLQADKGHPKGEFVLIIPARKKLPQSVEALHCLEVLTKELPLKQAVKLAALLTGVNKNVLYAEALSQQHKG